MLESKAAVELGVDPAVDEKIWDEYFLNDEEEHEEDHGSGALKVSSEEVSDGNINLDIGHSRSKDDKPRQADSSDAPRASQRSDPLDQSQSILFTLPYDVRVLIWTFVVGGGLIHMTDFQKNPRPRALRGTRASRMGDVATRMLALPSHSLQDVPYDRILWEFGTAKDLPKIVC